MQTNKLGSEGVVLWPLLEAALVVDTGEAPKPFKKENPEQKQRKNGYKRSNGRYEGRFRPRSKVMLKQDALTSAAFKGCDKSGNFVYEFLEYFSEIDEKDAWLKVLKADFKRRKKEASDGSGRTDDDDEGAAAAAAAAVAKENSDECTGVSAEKESCTSSSGEKVAEKIIQGQLKRRRRIDGRYPCLGLSPQQLNEHGQDTTLERHCAVSAASNSRAFAYDVTDPSCSPPPVPPVGVRWHSRSAQCSIPRARPQAEHAIVVQVPCDGGKNLPSRPRIVSCSTINPWCEGETHTSMPTSAGKR